MNNNNTTVIPGTRRTRAVPAALVLAAITTAGAMQEARGADTLVPGWSYSATTSMVVPGEGEPSAGGATETVQTAGNEPLSSESTEPDDHTSLEEAGTEPVEKEPVRRYITREEKLEAGQRREITPWLYSTTLAEYEWDRERNSGPAGSETERSSVLTLQGGLELVPVDYFQAELVLEYDSEADETIIDELIGAVQWEPFEVEVGKQGLPFGEYFSRFASGPLIEFGETTETAVKLSYELGDIGDLSLTAYEGPATKTSGSGSDLDYVAAIESEPIERLSLGLSHLTDLADSDERLLREEGDLFTKKVGALSGYAFWVGDNYELSLEYVSALDRFRELDEEIDKPSAWNAELGLYLFDNLDFAFRVEGSDELEDAPERQLGIAATILLHERSTLTLELLHGRYKEDFVTDDEDNAFDDVTTVGILFSTAL